MNASTLSKKSLSVWAVAISFAIALLACGFASSAQAAPSKPVDVAFQAASSDVAASALDYDENFLLPSKVYRVSTKYGFYGGAGYLYNSSGTKIGYNLELKNARVKGSVRVINGQSLKIKVDKTCYIEGSIVANNIEISGSGTLYVKGGIKASGMVYVSRNLTSTGAVSSKAFYLKSYNTTHKETSYGIEAGEIYVTNKAKVYAKGYKYAPDYAGISCNYLTINNSGYVKGSGKRYGVDVYKQTDIASGSLYGSSTSATAETADYPCTGIYTGTLYSDGGTVSGTASGKGSAGLFIADTSDIRGTVKGYGKNYGYGIIQTNKDFVVNGGKVTAYGGNTAITTTRNVVLNNATVYAYGRKSTSTKSKYRVGNGIEATGNININNSKVTAVAKSSSTRYAINSTQGSISISGASTVSLTGKKGYAGQCYAGIFWSSPAIVKLNGTKLAYPVSSIYYI